jgi:glycosyltransferase involved in cell wall biosynthesis
LIDNLTAVVPFWNGHETLDRLLDSLPADLPVLVVDDHSDRPPDVGDRPGVRVIRPAEKGFFAGAVNAGLAACRTDVLVLNQDLWMRGDQWLERVAVLREDYALFGDSVMGHPAFPNGYVQGTFMFLRRDAVEAVGGLNEADYPLWGATAEWQLRACRLGFRVRADRRWRRWMGHEGRHGDDGQPVFGRRSRFGSAIQEALRRWPQWRGRFLATPPAISVIVPCYNYGRYLPDAIHSLVGGDTSLGRWEPPGQTFQSFEVVIVDDASTDDSWQAALALADPWQGIRAIRLPANRGTPGAINAGIRHAYGSFIHILSADDMREADGLEVLYRAVRDDTTAVAYGNIRIFGHGQRGRTLTLPQYDFDLVLNKNPMPAGILYARTAWEQVGGYPETMKYGREDWAFNIALGAAGYCGKHVGMSGNLYRREGQNRSLRTGNVHRGESGDGFSWRQTFMQQLKSLYPGLYAGERPMNCCGGGRTAKTKPIAAAAARGATPTAAVDDAARARALASARTASAEPGMEWLEYVGGNTGNSPWWGPATGTRYTFGGGRPVGQVYAEDVKGMLDIRKHTRPMFRRWQPPRKKGAVKVPPEKAAEANPAAPDDLTELAGVGQATAEKLVAAGYATFLALARTDAAHLALAAGIPQRTAEKATAGARERLGMARA